MTIAFHNPAQLWDIAGVDGLQATKSLFGEQVDRIALFQSLEADSCSILRLCEGNFRIAWYGDGQQFEAQVQPIQIGHQIWIKRLSWLSAIVLPESATSTLTELAVPKPPHRLDNLPLNCAVPARINGTFVLIWKHLFFGQPCFELQTALSDRETVSAKLSITQFSTLKPLKC